MNEEILSLNLVSLAINPLYSDFLRDLAKATIESDGHLKNLLDNILDLM